MDAELSMSKRRSILSTADWWSEAVKLVLVVGALAVTGRSRHPWPMAPMTPRMTAASVVLSTSLRDMAVLFPCKAHLRCARLVERDASTRVAVSGRLLVGAQREPPARRRREALGSHGSMAERAG